MPIILLETGLVIWRTPWKYVIGSHGTVEVRVGDNNEGGGGAITRGGGDNNDVLWKMHLYEYSNRIIYAACQNEFKSDPTLICLHMYHPTNKIEEYVDMGNLCLFKYFAKLSMS